MDRSRIQKIPATGWLACVAYAERTAADRHLVAKRRVIARMLRITEEELMHEEEIDDLPAWNPKLFMPTNKENT